MPLNPAGQSPTMGSSFAGPLPGNGPAPTQGISAILPPNASGLPTNGPSPQERVQAYMDQIKQFHEAIDALAQDHPEAAQELNDAKNQLTNSMSKVASAMSSPDASAPQPRTF